MTTTIRRTGIAASLLPLWVAGAFSFALCFLASPLACKPIPPSSWSGFFADAVDAEGLDARDARNRPLRAADSAQKLRRIFLASVQDALLSRDLPLLARARKTLERLCSPLREGWKRAKRWLLQGFEIAALFNFKRWAGASSFRVLVLALPALLFIRAFLARPVAAAGSSRRLPLRC